MIQSCLPDLIIRAYTKHHSEIRASFMSSPLAFKFSHYYRLFALSLICLLCNISLSSYIVAIDAKGISPWKGWADAHSDFYGVLQISAVEWKMDKPRAVSLQMSRFFVIFYALMFFVLFGFTEEVHEPYRNVLRALVKEFGKGTTLLREACSRRKFPTFGSHIFSSSMEKSEPTLPVSIHDTLPTRHDVMVSFAPNLTPNNVGTAESLTTLAEKQEPYPSIELTSDIGSLPTTPSSSHRTAPNSPAYYSFPPTPTSPGPVHVGGADNSKGTWVSDWSFSSNSNIKSAIP